MAPWPTTQSLRRQSETGRTCARRSWVGSECNMDNILYGLFILTAYGLPLATVVFIVVCIVRGEISRAEFKLYGLVFLWLAGGAVFSAILCAIMSANTENAERVGFAIYCVLSVLIYRLCKKEKEDRD